MDCPFLGSCLEPLAWSLEDQIVSSQGTCPLYSTIPVELRNLIWKFALTDCTSNPLERARFFKGSSRSIWSPGYSDPEAALYRSDIAVNLLQTCRVVYLETYTLPLSLNSYIVQEPSAHLTMMASLPWQFANIQRLDISLQQIALEGNILENTLLGQDRWCPLERHKGVYVAPRQFKINGRNTDISTPSSSFNFALVPADKEVEQQRLSDVLRTSAIPPGEHFPWSSSMRVRLAKPLVHLTLRLGCMDWWTWSDHPNNTDVDKQLALDPAAGDGSSQPQKRPTSNRMRQLADERRAGRDPLFGDQAPHHSTWAKVVGQFPDLQTLELVLETFAEKQQQLENVVECAKTWNFHIDNTQYKLVWNGEVEASRWNGIVNGGRATRDSPWYKRCTAFENRIIRFERKRAA